MSTTSLVGASSAACARKPSRRVIIVVNGLESEKTRAQESAKLLEWGLRRFENHKLFSAGDTVEAANIIMGKKESVPAIIKENVHVTIPKIALKNVKITAHFKEPLIAPIKAGQEIGRLEIDIPYLEKVTHPLYATESVKELGFFAGTLAKAKIFLAGEVTVANE